MPVRRRSGWESITRTDRGGDRSCIQSDFWLEIQGKSGNIRKAAMQTAAFLILPENHLQSQVILWLYIFFRL